MNMIDIVNMSKTQAFSQVNLCDRMKAGRIAYTLSKVIESSGHIDDIAYTDNKYTCVYVEGHGAIIDEEAAEFIEGNVWHIHIGENSYAVNVHEGTIVKL